MYDIAITGHRPKDLGCLHPAQVQELTNEMIDRASERAGPNDITIHTGGAIGIDQWVAQAIMRHPEYRQGLYHTLHMPFTFDIMSHWWTDAQKMTLSAIMNVSTHVCKNCPANVYTAANYQRRNEHMVNSSQVLIAFWTGKSHGGTWNCIQYALDKNVPVYNALEMMRRIHR